MPFRPLAAAALLALVPGLPARAEEAPPRPRLEASLRVEAVELPGRKEGLRELRYAFGKDETAASMREVLVQALRDRRLFERVEAEGSADYALTLGLASARTGHEEFQGWDSKTSSVEASADLRYLFRDAKGGIVARGEFESSVRSPVEGLPRRGDAARAWARLLAEAATRACTEAFEAAAFGNERPAPGGWIPSGKGSK